MSILYNEIHLKNDLYNKFKTMCFEAAMADLAKKSNPLAHSVPNARSKQLYSMVHGVLESLGGYAALEAALENDKLSIGQKIYLNRLDTICHDIATEASERLVKKVKEEDAMDKMADEKDKVKKESSDYVRAAKLSEKELTEFKHAIKDMDNDDIGEVIEKKVLSVVKSEKYAQLQDELMKNKLKEEIDSIAQSENDIDESHNQINEISNMEVSDEVNLPGESSEDDMDGFEPDTEEAPDAQSTVESFLSRLPGNYVLEHTSLFSTILEKAYEAIMGSNDKKVLYKDSAIHIATEAIGVERAEERFDSGMTTNQMIKSIMNDIHQFHGVNSNIAKEAMNDESIMDEALALTIDIYSALEAFYSVGLIKPEMKDVKGFVNQNTTWSKTPMYTAVSESQKPITTRNETFSKVCEHVSVYNAKCKKEIGFCNDMTALEGFVTDGEVVIEALTTMEEVNNADKLAYAIESVRDMQKLAEAKSDYLYDTTVPKQMNYAADEYIETFNAVESAGIKLANSEAVTKVVAKVVNEGQITLEGIGARGNVVSSHKIPTRYGYSNDNLTQKQYFDSVLEHVGLELDYVLK